MTWFRDCFGLIFWLVVVSTYSAYGLAAVWAGRATTGHWFPRAVAVFLLCGVWLLVPDYQLWLLFLTQTFAVLFVLWCLGPTALRSTDSPTSAGASSPRGRARFSLGDLFLVVLMLGVVFALAIRMPADVRPDWYLIPLPGLLLAFLTVLADWAVSGRARPWVRMLAVAVMPPTWMMAGWLWLARRATTRWPRAIVAISLVAMMLPTAVLYAWILWPRFLSRPESPADNGYDDLMRAAALLGREPSNIHTLAGEPLRDYVTSNKAALELALTGLCRPCSAPWPNADEQIERVGTLRQLTRLFVAQGRLCAADGQLGQAIESDLDAVRLGQAMAVDGFYLDHEVGRACEGTGLEGLRLLVGRLDERGCQQLSVGLAAVHPTKREPFDDVVQRHERYNAMTRSWNERLALSQLGYTWAAERKKFEWQSNRTICSARLLLAHVALRRYRLHNGRYPATLHELAPQYLDAAPVDPFNGQELIYRRHDEGYRLYSVGPDGKDNGGAPMTGIPPASVGDWFFDVALEPPDC
ncbi:MAG TPA: hypothetical protein VNH11_30550 [Pirellulales bacterium]|nr:hypothetical protein [Pirellulales bacterium]